MSVEIVRESGDDLLEAINALVPQLSSSTPPLAAEDLNGLLSQQGTVLFVYRDEESGAVLGMLTLATFDIPTGKRAWIEDVGVDGAARGQGAGYKLVEAAVQHALALGCKTVDLTSRPSRETANRLYRRAGFQLRETNVYRYVG